MVDDISEVDNILDTSNYYRTNESNRDTDSVISKMRITPFNSDINHNLNITRKSKVDESNDENEFSDSSDDLVDITPKDEQKSVSNDENMM